MRKEERMSDIRSLMRDCQGCLPEANSNLLPIRTSPIWQVIWQRGERCNLSLSRTSRSPPPESLKDRLWQLNCKQLPFSNHLRCCLKVAACWCELGKHEVYMRIAFSRSVLSKLRASRGLVTETTKSQGKVENKRFYSQMKCLCPSKKEGRT